MSHEPSIVVDPSLLPETAPRRRASARWEMIRRDLPSYIAIALSAAVIVGALLHLQARWASARQATHPAHESASASR